MTTITNTYLQLSMLIHYFLFSSLVIIYGCKIEMHNNTQYSELHIQSTYHQNGHQPTTHHPSSWPSKTCTNIKKNINNK